MKKIIAIFSAVAMMLVSCQQDGKVAKPNFPELQLMNVEAGKTYNITFVAEKPWTISLSAESQQYATLRYDGTTDVQHSGPAGENTVKLNVRSNAGSYTRDLQFDVDFTMVGYTEKLVECTVAKRSKVINVTGDALPGSASMTYLSEGGHPENGPFADAQYTYTVTHRKGLDAKGAEFYIQHDVDVLYNYAVYAKNKSGEFVKVSADEEGLSWLHLMQFGVDDEQKFRLYMYYTNSDAVLTNGVGYEAYVNIEDVDKTPIVSVYHVFNPDTEVITPTSFGLADSALSNEKGVQLVGSGYNYTLTIPNIEALNDPTATALKLTGYNEVNPGFVDSRNGLVVKKDEAASSVEADTPVYVCYLAKDEKVEAEQLVRSYTLSITAQADSNHEYNITVILEWAPEAEDETTPVDDAK